MHSKILSEETISETTVFICAAEYDCNLAQRGKGH